jgi:stage II sporulation protein D
VGGEVASTEAAVDATRGQVVTYDGKPVVTYFFSTSGGRTEDVENSFIGSPAKPWLKSVEDPYDDASPRHRWGPYRMTMSRAAAKLGSYVKGTFRGIDVVKRGESPRVVYADVVGSRGRMRVTGPQLRAIFGLFDTWATFNVITASGTTSNPTSSGSAPETGTAGAGSGAGDPATGGASPGGQARTAFFRSGGAVAGHVGWVEKPTRVALQWRERGRWHTVDFDRTTARGVYRFRGLGPGAYRIRWRGVVGPVVRL